jgi:hypothetical protein
MLYIKIEINDHRPTRFVSGDQVLFGCVVGNSVLCLVFAPIGRLRCCYAKLFPN